MARRPQKKFTRFIHNLGFKKPLTLGIVLVLLLSVGLGLYLVMNPKDVSEEQAYHLRTSKPPTETPPASPGVDLKASALVVKSKTADKPLQFYYEFSSPNTTSLRQIASINYVFSYDNRQIFLGHTSVQPQTNWIIYSTYTSAYFKVTPGSHRVKACIDTLNILREPNERNNCKEVSFYVKGRR